MSAVTEGESFNKGGGCLAEKSVSDLYRVRVYRSLQDVTNRSIEIMQKIWR